MGPNVMTSAWLLCRGLLPLLLEGSCPTTPTGSCLHCQGCRAGVHPVGWREMQLFISPLLVSLPKCCVCPRRVCLNQWVMLRNGVHCKHNRIQLSSGTPGTTPPWLAGALILLNIHAGPSSSLHLGNFCLVIPQTTFSFSFLILPFRYWVIWVWSSEELQ